MRDLDLLFPGNNANGRDEQIHAIVGSFRDQIPFLYASMMVNLAGLHVAIGDHAIIALVFLTTATLLLAWRAVSRTEVAPETETIIQAKAELVRVTVLTLALCVIFAVWSQILMTRYPAVIQTIAFFNILAALGATYGLSSFPRVALLPLIILALPVSARLLTVSDSLHRAMGLSLLLATFLFLPLLHRHSQALTSLISSRAAVMRERNRAASAEVAALKRADEDTLTKLPNRAKLLREIDRHLNSDDAAGGCVVAICDLDGLKRANDVFGHAAGDQLLIAFAERLKEAFKGKALVARMGGDEFALFWRTCLSAEQIAAAGTQICNLAAQPTYWQERTLSAGASCGFAKAGPDGAEVRELLRQADAALYIAKAAGRGGWEVYDESALARDERRTRLEKQLFGEKAFDELTLEFQPIYCMHNHRILFVEALARWKNHELGNVRPHEFIGIAETAGKIDALNDALLEKALHAFKGLGGELSLSFNLSGAQISRPGAAQHIITILGEAGVAPERMLFEINETAILADLEVVKKEIGALQDAGCLVALDDFGAGPASISALRSLNFDMIKLDVSLTRDLATCRKSRDMVAALVNLCHAAEAQCLAEHVETSEQLTLLRAMGCDLAQGYFLSRPLETASLHGFIEQHAAAM